MLPHKMRIVVAIMDELINTQVLASRAESTHSDSAYPFVGLSIFTEGLHRKILTQAWKIHLKKNAERSPYQHVSTNTNCHRSNLQELSLPAKDALFVGVPCTFSWHAADVAEGCQVSHGPRDHLLERAACLRWHQNRD